MNHIKSFNRYPINVKIMQSSSVLDPEDVLNIYQLKKLDSIINDIINGISGFYSPDDIYRIQLTYVNRLESGLDFDGPLKIYVMLNYLDAVDIIYNAKEIFKKSFNKKIHLIESVLYFNWISTRIPGSYSDRTVLSFTYKPEYFEQFNHILERHDWVVKDITTEIISLQDGKSDRQKWIENHTKEPFGKDIKWCEFLVKSIINSDFILNTYLSELNDTIMVVSPIRPTLRTNIMSYDRANDNDFVYEEYHSSNKKIIRISKYEDDWFLVDYESKKDQGPKMPILKNKSFLCDGIEGVKELPGKWINLINI